jgi:SAM-dependent methyltransferase
MYEFRRNIMAFLHHVAMAIGGEREEDYAPFENEVSREMRLAAAELTVLETGCGPGTEAIRLLTEFGAKQVIATDTSYGMLLAARQKNPHLLLVQADARHLPFRENAIDIIYSNCMYHHIEVADRRLVLQESLRVARQWVLLKEIAGFENAFFNWIYMLYYSIVDGSAYRLTVERWLEFLGSSVQRYLRRPERALVFRYVFFVLDSSKKQGLAGSPGGVAIRG